MRVMVLVKATADSEAGILPESDLLEAMGNYNEQLVDAGIMLSGEGLKPSSAGKRIGFEGANRQVADGPFTDMADLVAGFWLWEVTDMDEAIEWAKRCPGPNTGRGELELRPLFELEDFGEAMTPELTEQQKRMREQTDGR